MYSTIEIPKDVEVEPEMIIAYQSLIIDSLIQHVADLETQNRLVQQLAEALSDKNRYYASKALDKAATDNEAFLHYVFSGGKRHFDEIHPPALVAVA